MIDEEFAVKLLSWYKINKRQLPWRDTKDPYIIWISEIILQQTKVNQGMPYFYKFIEEFPNVFELASASEQKVLKLWQGLGYYSRARNLHFTAKYISTELNGVFPNNYKSIIKLKGVGEYTAAAISSFSFNEKKAVVDGNVYRLLSRYYGISDPIDTSYGKKTFSELAFDILPKNKVNIYNQAIMEFGALQCTPKKPKCNSCPLSSKCYSHFHNITDNLPVKSKRIKIKKRAFNYIVITDGENICLEKRTKKDIWENLYEFPMIEQEHELFIPNKKIINNALLIKKKSCNHILTHQKISAVFWHFLAKDMSEENFDNIIKIKSLSNYPVPKIVENYIKENLLVEV